MSVQRLNKEKRFRNREKYTNTEQINITRKEKYHKVLK